MRKLHIAGNWKMYKTLSQCTEFFAELKTGLAGEDINRVEAIVCPPLPYLHAAALLAQDTGVKIGAQNCAAYPEGAHTGETGAFMLPELGCRYVILGHSERRRDQHESDEEINIKMRQAQMVGLTPILCVGETREERESGFTRSVVLSQLEGSLQGLPAHGWVLAYEPVWAIGTGLNATPEQAQEVHGFIRKRLVTMYGQEAADQAIILYGGSVKPGNLAELVSQPDIDGGLIGGASLVAADFIAMIKTAQNIQKG